MGARVAKWKKGTIEIVNRMGIKRHVESYVYGHVAVHKDGDYVPTGLSLGIRFRLLRNAKRAVERIYAEMPEVIEAQTDNEAAEAAMRWEGKTGMNARRFVRSLEDKG